MVLILAYTPLSLFLFARAGQVDWAAGATLGVGSMTGALIASRLAIRKGAAGWIRWVVIAAALAAALRMLLT